MISRFALDSHHQHPLRSGRCLLLLAALIAAIFPASALAQFTPAFGPQQFTRHPGAPQTFTANFPHCGAGQQCQIVIVNGNASGGNRVSSATVSLNGVLIAGPNAFNQKVARIVKPVMLGANNQLTVKLASAPGSFLTIEVECATSPVVLGIGGVGDSLLNPTTLLSAVPLVNNGTAAAQNVNVTGVALTGGTLTTPTLPSNLGSIPVGGHAVLNADFTGSFAPLGTYPLALKGTYAVGSATYCFTLNTALAVLPAAPGSNNVGTVNVPSHQVTGAPFPHQPNNFDDDDPNGSRWTVPIAPLIAGTPTPTSTSTMPAPIGDPPAIVFDVNHGLGFPSGTSLNTASSVAEPSGAANAGGIAFVSANWIVGYSTDGGSTWKSLDPSTVFPADIVGFCCDQVIQYVPSIDRFIWLLQGNGNRIASASPADLMSSGATAWTYWNLNPEVFGQPTGTGFDYPDVSIGNNALYISYDVGWPNCPKGCTSGHQVLRISLSGIQAGGSVEVDYTNPGDAASAWGAHLTQDTGDEIFWAGHNDNTHLRVFSLAEGSNTYYWRDIEHSSWSTSGISSNTPDSTDWMNKLSGFPGTAVLGSTRVGNTLWFSWSAGTDSNFKQPHVEILTLDRGNDFAKLSEMQIWNPDYAFGYPAMATNVCSGEVGLSLEFGGGGNYENHVVGFWGDYVLYITTGSNAGTTRFGDYVTIRQHPATSSDPGNLFNATGYGVNAATPPATGTTTDVHYVVFGRPSSACGSPIK